MHTGGDALHGNLQDVVNRSSVIVVLERVALQKCDSKLFHAELIAIFFVLKRASRDEVSHLAHVERSDVERTLEELVRQILVHPRGVRRLNFFGFREQADVLGDGEKITAETILKFWDQYIPSEWDGRLIPGQLRSMVGMLLPDGVKLGVTLPAGGYSAQRADAYEGTMEL